MNAEVWWSAPTRMLSAQGWLFWLCVMLGAGCCVAVFWVTIRHHRQRTRLQASRAAQQGEAPVIYDSSLRAEIFWVLIPLLMVLGLGAWALTGDGGEPAAQDRHAPRHSTTGAHGVLAGTVPIDVLALTAGCCLPVRSHPVGQRPALAGHERGPSNTPGAPRITRLLSA
ncbi:MAG: hypothetical protein Q4E06_11620 [Lautropia sp.]|nr:hypothetical protein [Lautropia sp.]